MDTPSGLPAGFAVGTSGDEATQATLALEQPVSEGVQTNKVVDSTWQVKDFVLLSESEEVILKKQIASKLGIHYGNANQDKPFAEDFEASRPTRLTASPLRVKPSAPRCSIATSQALPVRKPSQTLATCPWWSRDA